MSAYVATPAQPPSAVTVSGLLTGAGSLLYAAGVVLAALLEDCVAQASTALRGQRRRFTARGHSG